MYDFDMFVKHLQGPLPEGVDSLLQFCMLYAYNKCPYK
jgi:hypothetical protein